MKILNNNLIKSFIAIIFSAFIILPALAEQDLKEQVRSFTDKMGNEVLQIINDKQLSDNDKNNKLTELFHSIVDTKWIGDFALGRYASNIDPAKYQKYQQLFRDFLTRSYVPNFRKYTSETFNISSVTKSDNDNYSVTTIIKRPSRQPLKVNYMVKPKKDNLNEFIITDIIAEGVSLKMTKRSEFGSILASNGIDNLIEQLQFKNSKQ